MKLRAYLLLLCAGLLITQTCAQSDAAGAASVPKTKVDFSLEALFEQDVGFLNYTNVHNFKHPRNVTDFYKGQWGKFGESAIWRFTSDDEKAVNLFDSRAGIMVFQITTKPSPLYHVDTVQGEMVIRDGMWNTDSNKRYTMQGLYFWDTGDLFILANPMGKQVIQGFDLALNNQSTIKNVLANTEMLGQGKGTEGITADDCVFKALFKTKPAVPPEKATATGETRGLRSILDLKGVMHSPNCKIGLLAEASSVQFDTYYRKATNYVLMVTVVSCIQIWLTIRQMEATSTQASAAKVSLLTIGMQAIIDSYLSLIHLTAGIIVESVFNPYATASFVKFVLFSIFEMRYFLFIFKARNPQTFAAGWRVIRRKLSQLYMRFYAVIFLGFILIYYFNGLFLVLLFGLYSIWIPQIICNATQDTDNALTKRYVIGMTITRSCIPLYFYGCPKNFLHAEPDYMLVSYLVIYLCTQAGILFMQDVLGPRWFIPKRFLPEKYNYRRSIDLDPESGDERECVICMNTVKASNRDYMITPCNHVYHDTCLRQWMAFKMECPTCRGQLPYP